MKKYIQVPADYANEKKGVIPIYRDGNGNYWIAVTSEVNFPAELLMQGALQVDIDPGTLTSF